jgi:hypothetical protein
MNNGQWDMIRTGDDNKQCNNGEPHPGTRDDSKQQDDDGMGDDNGQEWIGRSESTRCVRYSFPNSHR